MLRLLASYVKLIHALTIAFICFTLISGSKIRLDMMILELVLSVLNTLISYRSRMDYKQIIFSLSLTYTLIPNNFRYVSGLFFFKIFYVYQCLGEAIEQSGLTGIFKVVLSIMRFTIVEYLFLGLCIFAYKMFCFNDPQGEVAEDYLLLYKFIVTAATIGYGDVTPKTRLQIYYFTYIIPFICGSFIIYTNAVIPLFMEFIDLILGSAPSAAPTLQTKAWKKDEQQNFGQFIDEVSKRSLEEEESNKKMGNNWIAITAVNYEKQIPLISQILGGHQNKEVKLKVSSKVKRQYFPKGWTILQAGQTSSDLIMVDEGEIETPQVKKNGFVFNQEGFFNRSPASSNVVAKDFVTVWSINMNDLSELAKSVPAIQESLNSKQQL